MVRGHSLREACSRRGDVARKRGEGPIVASRPLDYDKRLNYFKNLVHIKQI